MTAGVREVVANRYQKEKARLPAGLRGDVEEEETIRLSGRDARQHRLRAPGGVT
jgi:hypothetical protein